MKQFILAAGVAALAITAPAMARPGGDHGAGRTAAAQHRGGGHAMARTSRGGARQAAPASDRQPMRMAQSRGEYGHARAKAQGRVPVQQRMAQAHNRPQQRMEQANNRQQLRMAQSRDNGRALVAQRQQVRMLAAQHGADMRAMRNDRNRQVAIGDVNRGRYDVRSRGSNDARWINADYHNRGLINGCPPGLAAKNNGCLPPGQARQLIGQRIPDAYRSTRLPTALRDYYRDDDQSYYRYGDGYLYRVNRQDNLVSALLPMFGGALGGIGTPFPAAYSNYNVPSYYQPFYPDNGSSYYRYADGYVYGVDRNNGLIDNVVPLLAGGYGVGQLLPAGYSTYNVPYQYRDYYPDSSDAYYRYAPGAIYQVDPQTSLVTSVASLLSPTGFAVGQPLPMGYDAYNVPYPYRSQYYDTPDAMYRYNNGSIYQVDPTTQLISAVIRAIV